MISARIVTTISITVRITILSRNLYRGIRGYPGTLVLVAGYSELLMQITGTL